MKARRRGEGAGIFVGGFRKLRDLRGFSLESALYVRGCIEKQIIIINDYSQSAFAYLDALNRRMRSVISSFASFISFSL